MILGVLILFANLNIHLLGIQDWGVFTFQLLLAFTLLLSFFVDKYSQTGLIFISILYLSFYWFLRNFLIVGQFSEIFGITDIILSTNSLLLLLFATLIGLIISSMIFYKNKIILACSIVLVVYCSITSVFGTFIYSSDVIGVNLLLKFNFADFFIVFYQLFAVKIIVFTFIYSLIIAASHSIHLKIVPSIRSMGVNKK